MKRKITTNNKRKLTNRYQSAKRHSHPVNLYLSISAAFLKQSYTYIASTMRIPIEKQHYQEISFNETFTQDQIITAIYQDLHFWETKKEHSDAIIFIDKQKELLERLFPQECSYSALDNVDLEWFLMDSIGHETGDYSLQRKQTAIFKRPTVYLEQECTENQHKLTSLPKQFQAMFETLDSKEERNIND